MSMIKVIQPGAQDFSEPVAALIKISSRGLLGADKQVLIKRAGAEFANKLQHIKFAKDEVPVHMIAIGATEDYGPNRNGDGFLVSAASSTTRRLRSLRGFTGTTLIKTRLKALAL